MIAGLEWGDLVSLVSLALTIAVVLREIAQSLDRHDRRLTNLAERVRDLEDLWENDSTDDRGEGPPGGTH